MGRISLVSRDDRLISLDITGETEEAARERLITSYNGAIESTRSFAGLKRLLDRFFSGKRVDFDVEYDIAHLGDFTRRVLNEVSRIPFGAVRSYREIGMRLGYPMAARAVGQAVGRNPIPIVIPCHRVVTSSGGLGGFSMGLGLKERLLALEGVTLPH